MERELDQLYDSVDIKVLILYVISVFEIPVSHSQLFDALLSSCSANYFDFTENFAAICDKQLVVLNKNNNYEITPNGYATLEALSSRLPHSVRTRAKQSALDVLHRTRYEKDAPSKITETGDGFILECRALEGDVCTFDVKVLVPSREIAEQMQQAYQRNPFRLFSGIIESFSAK